MRHQGRDLFLRLEKTKLSEISVQHMKHDMK